MSKANVTSNIIRYNGQVKIWFYIVIGLSIMILGYYLIHFKKIWKNGPYLWVEIFLFLMWLSSGLANGYPIYGGGLCNTDDYNKKPSQHFYWVWCWSYISSLAVGWINIILFSVSIYFARIILREKKKQAMYDEAIKKEDERYRERRRNELFQVKNEVGYVELVHDGNEVGEVIELEELPRSLGHSM
ncbi:2320_t:CDS:2 [Acaulospora morrowiae]|uniref:2320_t:CDS:1 n=1 Tax=Acaulospora morrowiae TaxID=94023 RepID=A0A9N8ZL27_9GLOM|nr:2320_t:CDS:2 [Acaulospora morrowiae]